MDAIRTENLRKVYKDVVAVDGLTLSVQQGELFSLLGVNGAGKTTTIKMLSCLTAPTDGDAFLHGQSIRSDSAAVKSMIAVVGRHTGRDQQHTIQSQLLRRRLHRRQMAAMDGVERSAVNADLHQMLFFLSRTSSILRLALSCCMR